MDLSHITNLSLSDNYIKKIDSLQFYDLNQMIDLNLSGNLRGNLLTTIDSFTFTTTKSLVNLNLGTNKLTSLSTDTFNSLTNLHALKLDHNHTLIVVV
jgi:hypothetical protein